MRAFRLTILVCVLVFAWVEPAYAQQVKNVAVSRVEPGQATIHVKTDFTSDVTIEYGTAPSPFTSVAASSGRLRHEVALTGLPDSARIYYRLTVTESAEPVNTQVFPVKSFSAFKAAGMAFSFTVAGDNRPAPNNPISPTTGWIANINRMIAESPDLALHSGDIIMAEGTDTGSDIEAKYDAYFGVTGDLTWSAPFYMAAGNHERLFDAVGMNGYLQEFTLPQNNGPDAAQYGELYYSFDHGDTHFVILCSEIPGQYGLVTGNQLLWLGEDLAASNMPWTVVVVHQPLHGQSGTSSHQADPWSDTDNAIGQQNRADLTALFEQYGVDIVFHGHDHYYKHHAENGIQYVVTGGGGSPLYDLPAMEPGDIFQARAFHHVKIDETAESLGVSAIDTSGAVLESFTLGTPVLGLSTTSVYWASYADYMARELSVDYALDNRGGGDALGVEIIYAQATNGVFPLTAIPAHVADLDKGQNSPVTLKYLVPHGVVSFRTISYAACDALDGTHYVFPGPPPGA